MRRTLTCLVLILSGFLSRTAALSEEPEAHKPSGAAEPDAKGIGLFNNHIKPVLDKHCYECHSKNADDIEGGLELDSPSGMMRGGDSGPYVDCARGREKSADSNASSRR